MRLDYDELKAKFAVSPLEVGNILLAQELHDEKEVLKVLEEIDAEIKGGQDIVDMLLLPVFYTVIDRLITGSPLMKGSSAASLNITPTLVIEECKSFSYEKYQAEACTDNSLKVKADNYAESKVVRGREEYIRKEYEDPKQKEKYRISKANGGTNKTIEDEYSTGRVYLRQKDADRRNYRQPEEHRSNVDHVVPLHVKYQELKDNYALSKSEIKELLNSEANLAITNASLNKSKSDTTNSEYVKKHDLDEITKQKMLDREHQAIKDLNAMQNKAVAHKLINTKAERNRILTRAGNDSLKHSVAETKNNTIGRVIIEFIKVAYFELTDTFKNGICYRTGENSKLAAFKVRIGRAVKYIFRQCCNLAMIVDDFVTSFIKSLFNAIVNLFAGFLKNAWNIIKSGITSIFQAVKILLTSSEEMSGAEKCDAIMKLAVATATMILGESLEAYLRPMLGNFADIMTPIVSGLLSAVIIFLLEKLDIFGVSIERKRRRVKEVFEARIADIQQNIDTFNKAAIETLVNQRQCFDWLMLSFSKAEKSGDLDAMALQSFQLAKFFNVELEYKNEDEFLDFLAQPGNLKF